MRWSPRKKVLIIKQIQPVNTTVRLAALRIRRLISEEVFKVLNTLVLAPILYLRGNYFPLHNKHIEVTKVFNLQPKTRGQSDSNISCNVSKLLPGSTCLRYEGSLPQSNSPRSHTINFSPDPFNWTVRFKHCFRKTGKT